MGRVEHQVRTYQKMPSFGGFLTLPAHVNDKDDAEIADRTSCLVLSFRHLTDVVETGGQQRDDYLQQLRG
jgi:hypothetical protein